MFVLINPLEGAPTVAEAPLDPPLLLQWAWQQASIGGRERILSYFIVSNIIEQHSLVQFSIEDLAKASGLSLAQCAWRCSGKH